MLDEIVSALLGEPLVLGEGQAIEEPEEEFEGEQQDKDDRYGNSNLKHGKALLRVRVCGRTPPTARAAPRVRQGALPTGLRVAVHHLGPLLLVGLGNMSMIRDSFTTTFLDQGAAIMSHVLAVGGAR